MGIEVISVILTVHNKENLIEWVLRSILENIINTQELIVVLDGCTDRSESMVNNTLCDVHFPSVKILYADDVFEVKANNLGLRASTQPYCMIIQDDMVIQERGFDDKLLTPLLKFNDVFAVSARTAHDNVLIGNEIHHVNIVGKESNLAKGVYAVRDSCNRGPLVLNHSILEKLNYLDEEFAPLHLDDHDLCMRAWKEFGMVSGSYMIDFRSDYEWGSSHLPEVATLQHKAWMKNAEIIKRRHHDILTGEKHDEERECLYGTQV